jgi:AcrR family transcriptional regulator
VANTVEQLSPTLQRAPGRAGTPAEGRVLRARGQQTVRSLLDAGLEVFATRGYHPAHVDDIVKVAKTSHGTFYLYFASKEDLFRALSLDVSDEMTALVDSLGKLTPDAEGRRVLRSWLEQFGVVHARYGAVIKAWTEAEIDASDFGRMGTDLLGGLVTALADRIEKSPAVVPDPQLAALAIVAMVERANYYGMTNQLKRGAVLDDTLADIAFAALFGSTTRRKEDL